MHKRIIAQVQKETASPDQDWLNVEGLAEVEITSEEAAHPIESALLPGRASGWRAAEPGKQTIRLLFNHPQRLRRIWMNFVEPTAERTQEYVVRWSPDSGRSFREIGNFRAGVICINMNQILCRIQIHLLVKVYAQRSVGTVISTSFIRNGLQNHRSRGYKFKNKILIR